MMQLATIYEELYRQAAHSGQDRHADLPRDPAMGIRGPARMALRVEQNGQITLTIGPADGIICGDSHTDKIALPADSSVRSTAADLDNIRRACKVPASAIRWPADGQHTRRRDGATWWIVAFRWLERTARDARD